MMTQAYNDWHIDEWAASYPGRFIPLGHSLPSGIPRRWPTRFGGWPRRAAGPSPCLSFPTSRAFRATTTSSTGTRSSGRSPRSRW